VVMASFTSALELASEDPAVMKKPWLLQAHESEISAMASILRCVQNFVTTQRYCRSLHVGTRSIASFTRSAMGTPDCCVNRVTTSNTWSTLGSWDFFKNPMATVNGKTTV